MLAARLDALDSPTADLECVGRARYSGEHRFEMRDRAPRERAIERAGGTKY
jgi:hypothetical protein